VIKLRATLILIGLLAAGGALGAPSKLVRIAWLQGCWKAESPSRVIEENWTAPRGGAMIGVSSTVRGDSLVEYELLVLRQVRGALAYEAHPSGQAVTTFTARELTDSTVVFADPAHDYPQEVGYQRVGVDSLVAWIDGTIKGKPRRVEFRYARVKCSGP